MTIKDIAFSYIGQKELSGNSGFEDAYFEEKMKAVGWQKPFAWCILFCELVWTEAMPTWKDYFSKMFSASVVQTWNNFRNTDYASKTPIVGSIVIFQKYSKGKPTSFGHAGIVTEIYANSFATVEGNTNALGSREGDRVAPKMRQLDFKIKDGLVLKGFILPISAIINKTDI
jgi:hypothetical protein